MDRQSGRGRRGRFSPEVKWHTVQEARQGGILVSQVCQKNGIRPGQFYQWEKRAEQGALQALREQRRGRKRLSPREEELTTEIERLREVIAEISAENPSAGSGQALALKKGRWH